MCVCVIDGDNIILNRYMSNTTSFQEDATHVFWVPSSVLQTYTTWKMLMHSTVKFDIRVN